MLALAKDSWVNMLISVWYCGNYSYYLFCRIGPWCTNSPDATEE